jgi:hypothetical protein
MPRPEKMVKREGWMTVHAGLKGDMQWINFFQVVDWLIKNFGLKEAADGGEKIFFVG